MLAVSGTLTDFISDTQRLAMLIDERDEVLEELEIAETKYIRSFRLTTPDPSILSFEPPIPTDPSRPYISRPKPLHNSRVCDLPCTVNEMC